MSKERNCATCKNFSIEKVVKNNTSKTPSWLKKHNFVEEFINATPVKLIKPKTFNLKVSIKVDIAHKNKYVLYWAALPSNSLIIKSAKSAYGDFSNYGVVKVNELGNINMVLKCPQPYKTVPYKKQLEETFYRHVHFCFSDKYHRFWEHKLYTKVVVCHLTLKETLYLHANDNIILLNVLPCEYYAKSHIPNSFNLPYNKIKNISEKDLIKWIKELVNLNYHKLNHLVNKKKINIYELPIVVYCAHDKCVASEIAALELLKKGFVNVMEYKGGMKEYLKL